MSVIVKSGVPGKVPTANQLDYGQIAINYADQKLYFKNSSNVLAQIATISKNTLGSNMDIAAYRYLPWVTAHSTLQFGYSTIYSNSASTGYVFNAYFDGAWKYLSTNTAARFYLDPAGGRVDYAISGTVDTALTFNTAWSFNTSGVINLPQVPAFQAYGANAAAIAADVIFGTAAHNNGSYYNTSNGRFTAPVTGRYQFHFNLMVQNTNAAGEYRFALYINGSAVAGPKFIYQKPSATSWNTMSGSCILYLTAGQYVTVRFETGQTGATVYAADANFSSFSGALIG